jgi:hypothetical protein
MRTLIYLGQVNALRNLGRSIMTVIAMGLAAFMMTASLTVGEGYTTQRAAEYRAYVGGDVLVYPAWTWPTETDLGRLKTGEPGWTVALPSFGGPLRYFHPNYYSDGYLTGDTGQPALDYSMFRDRRDMDAALTAISGVSGVESVYAYSTIPIAGGSLAAIDYNRGGRGESVSLSRFYLRVCPPNLLADAAVDIPPELRPVATMADPPECITVNTGGGETLQDKMFWKMGVVPTGGRQVASSDGDALVAVINRRAAIPRRLLRFWSVVFPLDQQGQRVRLALPRIVPSPTPGQPPYFDFSDPVSVEIRVIGTYDVFSRLYSIMPGPGQALYEQLYLEAPELLMTQAAFDRLLTLMGLPPGAQPPVEALALRLENQAKAVTVVEALRRSLPGLSVVSVAEQAAYANQHGLPEQVYELTGDRLKSRTTVTVVGSARQSRIMGTRGRTFAPAGQPSVPADTGALFSVLLFGFAGLVAAGNATLVVLSRRTEFAILKAVGLRGFEVAFTVIVEVVTLAVVGMLIGFAAGEVIALPLILTNSVSPAAALRTIGQDFAVVVLTTLGCAVVFSLAPMTKTLSITVLEAMRANE